MIQNNWLERCLESVVNTRIYMIILLLLGIFNIVYYWFNWFSFIVGVVTI